MGSPVATITACPLRIASMRAETFDTLTHSIAVCASDTAVILIRVLGILIIWHGDQRHGNNMYTTSSSMR